MKCANCSGELKRISSPEGIYFECPNCAGRMISIPVLRREKIDPEILRQINSQKATALRDFKRKCPQCNRAMQDVFIQKEDSKLELEICSHCFCVWFDQNEFEKLPKQDSEEKHEHKLHSDSLKALAAVEQEMRWQMQDIIEQSEENKKFSLHQIFRFLGL